MRSEGYSGLGRRGERGGAEREKKKKGHPTLEGKKVS